jgi:hypothetical protein
LAPGAGMGAGIGPYNVRPRPALSCCKNRATPIRSSRKSLGPRRRRPAPLSPPSSRANRGASLTRLRSSRSTQVSATCRIDRPPLFLRLARPVAASRSLGVPGVGGMAPNKALELTGRRLVGSLGLPAGSRPVRGGFGGRPPGGAWYLHGRPAAQCRAVRPRPQVSSTGLIHIFPFLGSVLRATASSSSNCSLRPTISRLPCSPNA